MILMLFLKIVWARRKIFLRCLRCSCDVTKVGGLLCNTSPKMGTMEVTKTKKYKKDKDKEGGLVLCNTSPIDVKMVTMILEITMKMMIMMSLCLNVTQPSLIKYVMEILMSFIKLEGKDSYVVKLEGHCLLVRASYYNYLYQQWKYIFIYLNLIPPQEIYLFIYFELHSFCLPFLTFEKCPNIGKRIHDTKMLPSVTFHVTMLPSDQFVPWW